MILPDEQRGLKVIKWVSIFLVSFFYLVVIVFGNNPSVSER